MNEVCSLQISVRHDDGARQDLTVDADRALIGSGSHCEIRLPAEDAAVEQLLVSIDAAGLSGQVRSLERSVTLNGVAFVEGRLLPDSLLRIGRVQLTFARVETTLTGGPGKHKAASTPSVYALAAFGFPLGFYLLLSHRPGDHGLPSEVEPAALFDTSSAERCPQSEPESAAAFATQELLRAETARERAPFSGQDAVSSVRAFARAAACFSAVGAAERAHEAEQAGEKLKRSVETDFHVHRVRLERALATKSYEEARTEVRLLLSYVGKHGGAYAAWLSSLDRQIELKFAGKKRK